VSSGGPAEKANHNHHYHHLRKILPLHVHRKTSMNNTRSFRFPAITLKSFHDRLVLLISPSTPIRHVPFSLPLLLYPWGFQSNADFSIASVSLRNVCPVQFHFLLFIRISIYFQWAILLSSAFVTFLVNFIFIIRTLALIYSAVYSVFWNLILASHR